MTNQKASAWLEAIDWNENGLIPAIAQAHDSGQVLMLAWMNQDALAQTLATGVAHYWSRSRHKLWQKGESSGHTQRVKEIRLDCDGDTVLLKVEQIGGIACHTGRASCFYKTLVKDAVPHWQATDPVIKSPNDIYQKS